MSEAHDSPPVYCSEEIVVLRASSLTEQGWDRRTITDPSCIAELEELYVSLGFETTTTELDPASFNSACNTCAETACSTYQALYTRRAGPR